MFDDLLVLIGFFCGVKLFIEVVGLRSDRRCFLFIA